MRKMRRSNRDRQQAMEGHDYIYFGLSIFILAGQIIDITDKAPPFTGD